MRASCISLVCPSCNSNYEIYLRCQPHLIIISCPTCATSISCFEGESLILDEQTLSRLHQANDEKSILSIFHDIHKQSPNSSRSIINDDIVNLRIALHECKTFDDVMSVICKK
jgi:hypothetical protein